MPDPLISLLVAGLLAALGLAIFWPQSGLVARWQRAQRLSARVLAEDALKHIHQFELSGRRPTLQSIAGALNVSVERAAGILADMQAGDFLRMEGESFHLTAAGRAGAQHIIRAHRLWERHLADETGFAAPEWHQQAELYEHSLSQAEIDSLDAQLGHPTHDPHGDPIPSASGDYVPHAGRPLTELRNGDRARIAHLEDEPGPIYAQLVAEGLHPGQELRIVERTPQRVRIWAGGEEHLLAPIVAANISVVPTASTRAGKPAEGGGTESALRLSDLRPGEIGIVRGISAACRGPDRRRLLDLGVLPGTNVVAELVSPGGDPTAYRIRGAMIALRKEQTELIRIDRESTQVER